jgi:hypothetical protein
MKETESRYPITSQYTGNLKRNIYGRDGQEALTQQIIWLRVEHLRLFLGCIYAAAEKQSGVDRKFSSNETPMKDIESRDQITGIKRHLWTGRTRVVEDEK